MSSRLYLHCLLLAVSLLLASCAKLFGDIPLTPEVRVQELTVPCLRSFWVDCMADIGYDYEIVYSKSYQDYGIQYVRYGVVFELVLNHDGTVKTLEFGANDFVVLEGVKTPVVSE